MLVRLLFLGKHLNEKQWGLPYSVFLHICLLRLLCSCITKYCCWCSSDIQRNSNIILFKLFLVLFFLFPFLLFFQSPNTALPEGVRWVGCQGSQPHLRRYPCGVWTLFHVLTVQAKKAGGTGILVCACILYTYILLYYFGNILLKLSLIVAVQKRLS